MSLHATQGGLNEQFQNELEQRGTFEQVDVGLQRILERLSIT